MTRIPGTVLISLSAILTSLGLLNHLPTESITIPWLFLGSTFGLDSFSTPIFTVTNFVWLLAFLYSLVYISKPKQTLFLVFMGLMYIGNIMTLLSQDLASFYLFFTLMGFSTYGAIIHDNTPFTRLAGKRYLAYTITSEMLIFGGFIGLYLAGNSLDISVAKNALINTNTLLPVTLLLLAGLGVKLGIMPLHGWLPLAHPAAPVPASAVLSGIMLKTGIVGWIRLLPIGQITQSQLGTALAIIGLFTVFTGAILGVIQTKPKAILAYSSISQMGFIGILAGLMWLTPTNMATLSTTLLIFITHHALAKSSLFFSCGIHSPTIRNRQWLFWLAVLLPGLSLAGLPFTSGMIAKLLIKKAILFPIESLTTLFSIALPLSGITTSLLVFRFLSQLLSQQSASTKTKDKKAKKSLWIISVLASLTLPFVWQLQGYSIKMPLDITIMTQLAPILLGGFVFLLMRSALQRTSFDVSAETSAIKVNKQFFLSHKDEFSYALLIFVIILLSSMIYLF